MNGDNSDPASITTDVVGGADTRYTCNNVGSDRTDISRTPLQLIRANDTPERLCSSTTTPNFYQCDQSIHPDTFKFISQSGNQYCCSGGDGQYHLC